MFGGHGEPWGEVVWDKPRKRMGDLGQVNVPPWTSPVWLTSPENKDSVFPHVPTVPSTSWAFSKYFLVTGDASYSDVGGFPAVLIVNQPHGEQVQGMRHKLLPQRSGGLPGRWCGLWAGLGLRVGDT